MLSPLVSWLLSSSSSSSSSSEEESHDINTDESDYENDNVDVNEDQNDNMEDDEKDHLLTSCSVDDDDDTIPVALAVPDASPSVTIAFPATKDDKDKATTTTAVVTRSKRQRNTTYSIGTRQRLWTKQNEIELLKGYLDYIKQQGKTTTTTSLQNEVASLYDQVIPKLNAYFNKNQLVEKLRRLKRKHKMILDKGKDVQVPFKNSEEQLIFEISNKIWGNDMDHDVLDVDESRPVPESPDLIDNVKVKIEQVEDKRMSKRLRLTTDDDVNTTNEQKNGDDVTSIQGFIEETMRSCFSPLLKELLADEPLGALPVLLPTGEVEDEQLLKRRRVLELEVYLNRLELLQGQIKDRLEGLRSSLV